MPYLLDLGSLFPQFYSELLKTLPVNDEIFVAQLFSNDLPYLKNQVQHKTSPEKAVRFLDSVIEPSVVCGDDSVFYQLLNVMEDGTLAMIEFANAIRAAGADQGL